MPRLGEPGTRDCIPRLRCCQEAPRSQGEVRGRDDRRPRRPSLGAQRQTCHNQPMGLVDTFARPLRNLRLSVTDRCNLRCEYCMPEEDYVWLPREDLLQFEEMSTLVDAFMRVGVDRLRITGGEPLLRR